MLQSTARSVLVLALVAALAGPLAADGGVRPPQKYPGSLAETAQEAIIVFQDGKKPGEAVEDMVLKIGVKGGAANFAWVVPFPTVPEVTPEKPGMFEELYNYVQFRPDQPLWWRGLARTRTSAMYGSEPEVKRPVEVLDRKVVGRYDVATVRENEPGALNQWLAREGYQTFANGEDVIAYYRKKGYVFVCLKVHDAGGPAGKTVTLHPLRFTFKTGGRDGIYFPMKMTGLQKGKFSVNLYVFYRAWINEEENDYGFRRRGFFMRFRDWDSYKCKKGAGKLWSDPARDPYLAPHISKSSRLAAFFQQRHPGKRFYMTNLRARRLDPRKVRHWTNDLWLFPMYDKPSFVPFDARPGGPAATESSDESY